MMKRSFGLNTAIAIVVGSVIGSGIFMKPAMMGAQLGSPLLLLSVWIVAGIITMFGALSNSEPAAMFPETGGQYVFFQKMYGNRFAFLYAWSAFAVFNTAGNASIAYVFSTYADYIFKLPRFSSETEHFISLHIPYLGNFFPLENFGIKTLTIFIIALLTLINYLSSIHGGKLQRIVTLLNTSAIIILALGILFSGRGSVKNIVTSATSMPHGWAMFNAYMAALGGAFWAYDGWNDITFVAGEIKNPQKNIPKSLFLGLLLCIAIYTLVNLAYVYVLPIEKLSASAFVASEAASTVWNFSAGVLIAVLIMISTFSSTNSCVLAVSRVTYAMGAENKFFSWANKDQPKYKTPGNALILNGIWTCILTLSGSFDMLTDMLIFVSWFFYGMSALGVFILRVKMPDVPRAYKVWGYPIVPAFFIAFTVFFLISTLYTDIINYKNGTAPVVNSFLGILITCVGIPVYYLGRRNHP